MRTSVTVICGRKHAVRNVAKMYDKLDHNGPDRMKTKRGGGTGYRRPGAIKKTTTVMIDLGKVQFD